MENAKNEVAMIILDNCDDGKAGHVDEQKAADQIISRLDYERVKEKAEKWDALAEKIGKMYPELDEDGELEETGGDLADIGEIAATAFGYL